MFGDPNILTYSVLQVGCEAVQLLTKNGEIGRILTVFENTFYVTSGEKLLCIGHSKLGASPLNASTTVEAGVDWSMCGIKENQKVRFGNKSIKIGNLIFDACDASTWSPDLDLLNFNLDDVNTGLDFLYKICPTQIPFEGLGRIILYPRHPLIGHTILAFSERSLTGLRTWLKGLFNKHSLSQNNELTWLPYLIGLGPGLTPSGDDFIGGMLIALNLINKSSAAQKIWESAKCQDSIIRNPITRAHLKSASKGMGSSALHEALTVIINGRVDEIQSTIDKLALIGHTSGWDSLAGAITVLQIWLEQN